MSLISRVGHIIKKQVTAYMIHFEEIFMVLEGTSSLTQEATTYWQVNS